MIGLTKAIAVDHAAAGIRAVAICPGTVESEWITMILANNAEGRFINGSAFVVNGGMTAR